MHSESVWSPLVHCVMRVVLAVMGDVLGQDLLQMASDLPRHRPSALIVSKIAHLRQGVCQRKVNSSHLTIENRPVDPP